jgi:ferritin-like metal-binding protein YciE
MTHLNLSQDFFCQDTAGPFAVELRAPITTLPGLAEAPTEPTAPGSFEKHWLHTLAHALTEEIQELFSAEKQMTAMLSRLAQASDDSVLRIIYEAEAAQSAAHGQRLARVQEMLGQQPDGRTCLQIESLLLGAEETIAENDAGLARDLALVAATRKVKQFEIAGYGSARDFAQLLGLGPVADLLQQTLDEQAATDARLGLFGEILAAQMGVPEFQ